VVHAAIVAWTVRHHPRVAEAWLLPVAAETWDGYLNDINGRHVTEQHGIAALDAVTGPVAEGSVGGGTGMTRPRPGPAWSRRIRSAPTSTARGAG
jgi:D-aminopeptidase